MDRFLAALFLKLYLLSVWHLSINIHGSYVYVCVYLTHWACRHSRYLRGFHCSIFADSTVANTTERRARAHLFPCARTLSHIACGLQVGRSSHRSSPPHKQWLRVGGHHPNQGGDTCCGRQAAASVLTRALAV